MDWLRSLHDAGLPPPASVSLLDQGWLVRFPSESAFPEIELHPLATGPLAGPDQALAGMALARRAGVRTLPDARVLVSGSTRLLVCPRLGGLSGAQLLRSGRSDLVCAALGRTLAALRTCRQPEGDLPTRSGFLPGASTAQRAQLAAAWAVQQAQDLGSLNESLLALAAEAGPIPEPCLVHGRLGPGALRLTDEGPLLLDWGLAHLGDPAHDYAQVLLLDPEPRARVLDAAGGWPPGERLLPRLRAGLALAALTQPDRAIARSMAGLALDETSVRERVAGTAGPTDPPEPATRLADALALRLAQYPTPSGEALISLLGAAACVALSRTGRDLVRLGFQLLGATGGSGTVRPAQSRSLDGEHPAASLLASVLDEASPLAAWAGAAALTRAPPGAPPEGTTRDDWRLVRAGLDPSAWRLPFDLLTGRGEALRRAVGAATTLGVVGPHRDLAAALRELEEVDELPPSQHGVPLVLFALQALGARAAPLDPQALVFRLFRSAPRG